MANVPAIGADGPWSGLPPLQPTTPAADSAVTPAAFQQTEADQTVLCVDPTTEPNWDTAVAGCPGSTFFHGAAWARVLKTAYGYRPAYLLTRTDQHITSLAPLMAVASWLTGRRGVALPFTDEAAPLAADAPSFHRLNQAALARGREQRWKYVEYRGGRAFCGDVPASESFLGHRLDLTPGESALFARFESSNRRAVRKAEQSGLNIEFSRDLDAVRTFHRLMVITRRRHGVPPQPFAWFAAIQRHVLAQNQGWVALARHNGVPVAGAVYFHFGKTVIYKYGASDERFQHLRANNLVMWEAIKRHAAKGFATLDFGRTALDNPGLRKFKLSWGAVEHAVDYVRQDPRTGEFAAPQAPASGWRTRLFQNLPDPVTRLIGSALYKHVA